MSAIGDGPARAQRPGYGAAQYERAAAALERSPQLADAVAEHERETGREPAAIRALAAADRARRAARRGRSMADRMRSPRP